MHTDASGVAVGATLVQKIDKKEYVIAYFLRAFSKQQRKYSATERELLAIVMAIRNFYPYILHTTYTLVVYTDHKPLEYLQNLAHPKPMLQRWLLEI